jgi:cysteine-rich repeat protein
MKMGSALFCLSIALAACGIAQAQVCGNGVREGAEQCDDGNTVNMDGCSATCTFEQVQRVNQLNMEFGTSTSCPLNKLGGAFGTLVQSALQNGISNSVADGSTSAMMYFEGLADLSGQSATGFNIGLLNGQPYSTLNGYNGTSDVDWWYLPDPLDIDNNRLPTSMLGGNIAAGVLTAGPGAFGLRTTLAGAPATLQFSSMTIRITTGSSSTPMTYNGSATQGHLPAENLDPALTSFETAGSPGTLCGNVSAASLAASMLSSSIVTYCSGYTTNNSELDLLVGGCTYLSFSLVQPTQPDQVNPNAPVAGAGGPYHLAADASKMVTGCADRNNAVVPLATCLNAAAYSSYFTFTTDRVMFKDDVIFRDGFEQ